MLQYTNSKGETVDFNNRSNMMENFGAWISLKDTITSSDVVSWCDRRIAFYEHWIKECKRFKVEHQAKLIDGIAPEVLVAGLTKEQLQTALNAIAAQEAKEVAE